jgi:hypothetical protein
MEKGDLDPHPAPAVPAAPPFGAQPPGKEGAEKEPKGEEKPK